MDIIGRGNTVSSYCVAVGIGYSTFYYWVNKYPQFKDFYDFAMTAAEAIIEKVGMYDNDYNARYWEGRLAPFKRRNLKTIPDFYSKDPMKHIDAINSALKEGYITHMNVSNF